jgi:hypothetical protein
VHAGAVFRRSLAAEIVPAPLSKNRNATNAKIIENLDGTLIGKSRPAFRLKILLLVYEAPCRQIVFKLS